MALAACADATALIGQRFYEDILRQAGEN
jgi:hypothetical protein